MSETFQQRLHQLGEDVYARIENGEDLDVEAALMNAHLQASNDEDD
jgi:hypothetical protein